MNCDFPASERLVQITRTTAGTAPHDAWRLPPITTNTEMNMGEPFKSLTDIDVALRAFGARSPAPASEHYPAAWQGSYAR